MFDAQSFLGGLLKEVTSGGSSSGGKTALGMGALGVAMAAFEHFTQDKSTSSSNSFNTSKPAVVPNMPPPAMVSSNAAPPPPPMSTPSSTAPSSSVPPPPAPSSNSEASSPVESQNSALFLIDAMLAAANADGEIDNDEKEKIFDQLKQINSDQEGFDYVQNRMDNPPTLEDICNSAQEEDLAKQVYMVSLMAITVDTFEEASYINQLAFCLPLEKQTIIELNSQFQRKE